MCNGMPSPSSSSAALTHAQSLPEATGQCCATCKFFFPLRPDAMLCRRYPPQLTLLVMPTPMPRGVLAPRGQQQPFAFVNQSVFGSTTPDLWCGEFKAALTAT